MQKPDSNMIMYAAIAGKIPQIDPRAAHILEEQQLPARPQRPWSPFVLSMYLREIYRQGTLMLQKPELAAWLKKNSENAKQRIHESQVRLISSKSDRAA